MKAHKHKELLNESAFAVETKPEYLRPKEAVRIFGIGRSTLYRLIDEGKIKSHSLRARGSQRGTRLISYDSLKDYIESCD